MVGNGSPGGWTLPGYVHVQQLGSGAGGQVFLARHQGSGTLVAVKYLVPGLHADGDFREAYRSEAQLLAELESPHVTRLYEYVEGPAGSAIVMEAVEGSSLRYLMKQEGATTPEAALCILKGSLLGLAAAHDAGVVHRDYKPANVLVTPDGVSKLVDFGIATRSGEAAAAAGTPLYMAPEQFNGAPASPAGDVYAATVTFFECVTGERPFHGKNAVELMAQHALGTVPDDLVPEPLRPLIRAGMAKDPHQRPPSALEFVAALEQVADAAYGPEWEERGRRKIATLMALLPLLLLKAAAQPVPASTTSIATTVLGTGAPGAGAETEAGAALGKRVRRRPRTIRATVGVGAAGAIVVAFVAVAAASGAHGKQDDSAANSALVGATTMLTPLAPLGSAPASTTPTVAGTASHSPSASPSQTSATPTVSQSGPTNSTTPPSVSASSGTSAPPTSTSTTATPTHSTSSTPPPPTPQVDSITINSLTCDGPSVGASITVTTNGVAGDTVTFTWFTLNDNGSRTTVATSGPYTLTAGQTSQTGSARQSFQAYQGAVNWGVSVSSSPAPKSGDASMNINPYSNGCVAS
ncbi:serine/threonine-protein kinase [Actinospica sp.]|uniref:serine/threonine-protein kinase n=1 Tax=Actinospica sp. TaxID=1872142 RepID=UPI002B6BCEBE|nr:serine/threonine-protein kinase [Actinospica sp.]HWG28559.1 serine/threonine-protein kinase [Actinospica sp.]